MKPIHYCVLAILSGLGAGVGIEIQSSILIVPGMVSIVVCLVAALFTKLMTIK